MSGSASFSVSSAQGNGESSMPPHTEARDQLNTFWSVALQNINAMTPNDFKSQELPLARIKKIMKLDEDVKMISAEAPVLFAKAAELFIEELTLRAWVHTEDNKRRTLQRNDIAMAIAKFDQFDFLIDIVPREEIKIPQPVNNKQKQADVQQTTEIVQPTALATTTAIGGEPVQYYFQLGQQQIPMQSPAQPIQIIPGTGALGGPATIQLQGATGQLMPQMLQIPATLDGQHQIQFQVAQHGQGQQVIQIQQPTQQTIQQATQGNAGPQVQIVQQVINANGEIQQIPVTFNGTGGGQQLQLIRMPAGSQNQTPMIIQAPVQTQQQQTIYQIAGGPGQGNTVFLAPQTLQAAQVQGSIAQAQTQSEIQLTEVLSDETARAS